MSKEEKTISFFNQFFIYKKVRNVTLEQLSHLWKQNVSEEEEAEEDLEKEKDMDKMKKPVATKAKKVVGKRIESFPGPEQRLPVNHQKPY